MASQTAPVGILPALFPHTGRVAFDIAGVLSSFSVERRIKETDHLSLPVKEPGQRGGHRPSALSRSAPWGSTEKDWAMESI